ncbi:MAG: DinB family protein [Bacteroidia bacterium]
MAINQGLIIEFKQEAANTRKMLERIPADKYTWKPHEKSTELLKLGVHLARLPMMVCNVINNDELDFAKTPPVPPPAAKSVQDVLDFFDKNVADAVKALEGASDEHLMKSWTLRQGEKVYFTMPRIAAIRSLAFNHSIHHRGQLSVYLRLLHVPVPGMYGPSADEKM